MGKLVSTMMLVLLAVMARAQFSGPQPASQSAPQSQSDLCPGSNSLELNRGAPKVIFSPELARAAMTQPTSQFLDPYYFQLWMMQDLAREIVEYPGTWIVKEVLVGEWDRLVNVRLSRIAPSGQKLDGPTLYVRGDHIFFEEFRALKVGQRVKFLSTTMACLALRGEPASFLAPDCERSRRYLKKVVNRAPPSFPEPIVQPDRP